MNLGLIYAKKKSFQECSHEKNAQPYETQERCKMSLMENAGAMSCGSCYWCWKEDEWRMSESEVCPVSKPQLMFPPLFSNVAKQGYLRMVWWSPSISCSGITCLCHLSSFLLFFWSRFVMVWQTVRTHNIAVSMLYSWAISGTESEHSDRYI